MQERPKVPISEEDYIVWTKNCSEFIERRRYVTSPLSEEEAEYRLAFSIAVYRDVEQFERLLRAIYPPQNFYCVHVDRKTSLLLHEAVHSVANCFQNVFVSSRSDVIKWGDHSVLLPQLNCMRDLLVNFEGAWKYYMDLSAQEFPLRTNRELVQIAKVFNGSNDISGSLSR